MLTPEVLNLDSGAPANATRSPNQQTLAPKTSLKGPGCRVYVRFGKSPIAIWTLHEDLSRTSKFISIRVSVYHRSSTALPAIGIGWSFVNSLYRLAVLGRYALNVCGGCKACSASTSQYTIGSGLHQTTEPQPRLGHKDIWHVSFRSNETHQQAQGM